MSLVPDWSFFGNAAHTEVVVGNRRYRYAPKLDCYIAICSIRNCRYVIERKTLTLFTHDERNIDTDLNYVPPFVIDGDIEGTDLKGIHKKRSWLDGTPRYCRIHESEERSKLPEVRGSKRTAKTIHCTL